MTNSINKFTNRGIFFGISGVLLTFGIIILFFLLMQDDNRTMTFLRTVMPFLTMIVPITMTVPFIIGLLYSIKGRNEPNSWKKYISFIINGGGVFIIIYWLVIFILTFKVMKI